MNQICNHCLLLLPSQNIGQNITAQTKQRRDLTKNCHSVNTSWLHRYPWRSSIQNSPWIERLVCAVNVYFHCPIAVRQNTVICNRKIHHAWRITNFFGEQIWCPSRRIHFGFATICTMVHNTSNLLVLKRYVCQTDEVLYIRTCYWNNYVLHKLDFN